MTGQPDLVRQNAALHVRRGIGPLRSVYLRFMERLPMTSVVEFGCGDPAFLASLPGSVRRVGLDGNAGLAPACAALGIEFHALDFDRPEAVFPAGPFDAAVCSDVFEHLVHPLDLLRRIGQFLGTDGVLFSHVPNEFRFKKMLRVMFGRAEAAGHHSCREWDDLHLRRFTDLGYRAFLGQCFRYNVRISDLFDSPRTRRLARLGVAIPYCFQKGPTYLSTNDPGRHQTLLEIRRSLG